MYNYKLTIQSRRHTRRAGRYRETRPDHTGKTGGRPQPPGWGAVELHGSGRTDAGVHALGQVANVKLSQPVDPAAFLRQLNRYLPEDIAVTALSPAPERFHARLNAVSKTYQYRIWNSDIPNVLERAPPHPVPRPP